MQPSTPEGCSKESKLDIPNTGLIPPLLSKSSRVLLKTALGHWQCDSDARKSFDYYSSSEGPDDDSGNAGSDDHIDNSHYSHGSVDDVSDGRSDNSHYSSEGEPLAAPLSVEPLRNFIVKCYACRRPEQYSSHAI